MLFLCKYLFPAVLQKIQTSIFIIIYSDGKHKKQYECEFCGRNSVVLQAVLRYSKHPHIRTHNFRGQTDCVLIYRMLSEKSASGCS